MSERSAVAAFLIPPPHSFWKWVDGGRGVAWSSGETIGFRAEFVAVVQRLADKGLPTFGAIALLLSATRQEWPGARARFLAHAQRLGSPGGGDSTSSTGVTLRAIGHRLEAETAELLAGLDRIAALPPELFRTLAAKASLAEVVFESVDRIAAPDLAASIIAELESAADPASFEVPWPRNANAFRELLDIIESLKPGLRDLDADQLKLRLRTGLDEIVKPPEEDLRPAERVRRLLGDLGNDPELAELSKLARDLLAAVAVPRSLRRQEEVPAGGVSDISNRGQLDRLLLSELAHDDLTLAVRVAVNEALYIQRESPPREPPHHRVLLIDSGIRTWGVPRVYVTAVALALAATGDVHGELSIFRAAGAELIPVDLTTREGLVAHLESLDAHPHFGAALPALADVSGSDHPSERILITHEDVLEDREFRAAMRADDTYTGFAATVGRDGMFRMWAYSPAGRKLVRQAKLDLTEVVEGRKKPAPARRPKPPLTDNVAELPAILRIPPFPLWLPTTSAPAKAIMQGAGTLKSVVAITRDRRLLYSDNATNGSRELSDAVPRGRVVMFQLGGGGTAVALIEQNDGRKSRHFLCVTDLPHGPRPVIELHSCVEYVRGATVHDGVVYVIGRDVALAYGFGSEEPLASLKIPTPYWRRGRVFDDFSNCVFVLALTGSRLVMEPVVGADRRVDTVFELPGIEGQLSFRRPSAQIFRLGPTPMLLHGGNGPMEFCDITDDQRSILTRKSGTKELYRIDLAADGEWNREYQELHVAKGLHSLVTPWLRNQQLMNRFHGIYVDDNRKLCLRRAESGSNTDLLMTLVGGTFRMELRKNAITPPGDRLRSFERAKGMPGVGYRLRVAAWQDGSKAYLDSRGMVHLKSSDRAIPEITLVLPATGPIAAWTSDGRFYGPKFYHGSDLVWTGQHLMDHLTKFTERLL